MAQRAPLQGWARGGCCQGLLLELCRRQGAPWRPGWQQSLSAGCCLQATKRKHQQQSWSGRLAGLQGIRAAGQPCSQLHPAGSHCRTSNAVRAWPWWQAARRGPSACIRQRSCLGWQSPWKRENEGAMQAWLVSTSQWWLEYSISNRAGAHAAARNSTATWPKQGESSWCICC